MADGGKDVVYTIGGGSVGNSGNSVSNKLHWMHTWESVTVGGAATYI